MTATLACFNCGNDGLVPGLLKSAKRAVIYCGDCGAYCMQGMSRPQAVVMLAQLRQKGIEVK